ncbi:IclR family transcriptional regulator [Sphingomonas sp. 2SG]|uniref:IclR family transcriptional regulator n=1 Tax=Sphingomonas sp. 2SG TaxID=2502201 RepID=UPI0010F849AC|nr:IclR family transcriptional regulator [Sphingomonas sp. 2SG]
MEPERNAAQPQTGAGGSQTLMRGLDVVEAVARGATTLTPMAAQLGLSRSTTHRLASSLVERGYLAFTPRAGYRLGPKLLELGQLAHEQADIVQVARPHLEELSARTEDTVHFGVLDGDRALYLDKMPGRRRITISSRIGDRQPLTSTGLGKALMIDRPAAVWIAQLDADARDGGLPVDRDLWLARMRDYAATGCAFDLEENEDQIRCVAAPVRDAGGAIVGALSVSSAAQYMNDARMRDLADLVVTTAHDISRDLGWSDKESPIVA